MATKPVKKRSAPLIRWTPSLKKLKAISVRQPWAWLIVNGYKDIENRKWPTNVRGPVLIHAGINLRDFNEGCAIYIKDKYGVDIPQEADVGGIIGVVDIADCVEKHPSPWFRGKFGWVLSKPRRLPHKFCKGKLKFFNPDL